MHNHIREGQAPSSLNTVGDLKYYLSLIPDETEIYYQDVDILLNTGNPNSFRGDYHFSLVFRMEAAIEEDTIDLITSCKLRSLSEAP